MALLSPGGTLSSLYAHAPPRVKDIFASAYGFQVSRLRYGGSFARHLAEYRERDEWSLDQLVDWQTNRLQKLLRHAVAHVPYYRKLHEKGEFPIDEVRCIADLSKLPILDKDEVRKDPDAFLAEGSRSLHTLYTSGTTGTPLKLFRSAETIRNWYACFERRAREWHGVSRADCYAILGGQMVVPAERRNPPFWVYNAALRQLYMSSYHLAPQFMDAYLDEIVRRKIVHLYGYASAMDALAAHALHAGRTDVKLVVATSNAEPLYEHQRERIAAAFSCDVRDTYGNTELSVAAFECRGNRMHLSLDVAVTEVLDGNNRSCPAGIAGDFACTGLLNFDQVFIRYLPGDRGSMHADESPCMCGRHAPALASIEGRADDVLMTMDGRRIGRLDPVFKGGMHLLEAQIIQVARNEIQVKVVPAPGYSDEESAAIIERLQDRMGPVNVEVMRVEQIPRSANGKFRAVVNLVGKRSESDSSTEA